MQKKILITGSTDGIGLETAKLLLSEGHYVLLHGRNPAKLEAARKTRFTLCLFRVAWPGQGSHDVNFTRADRQ